MVEKKENQKMSAKSRDVVRCSGQRGRMGKFAQVRRWAAMRFAGFLLPSQVD